MGVPGLYALLNDDEAAQLNVADRAGRASMLDRIEGEWDETRVFPIDKAWELVHRCLGDGTARADSAEYPLRRLVLGGASLDADKGTLAYLISSEDICTLVPLLESVTPERWRQSFELMLAAKEKWKGWRATIGSFTRPDEAPYDGPADEEDFDYSWSALKGLRDFLRRAAAENRPVVFWFRP